MPESLKTRLTRWRFNYFPAYWGTGGRITYIADDWREVRVRLRLTWQTRNYVGTIFGGSLYGAVDPIFMIMLIKTLGTEYVVWDKAALVEFKQPGRGTLFARFVLAPDDVASIRLELEHVSKLDRIYTVDLADRAGVIHASIRKTIQVRRREPTAPLPTTTNSGR